MLSAKHFRQEILLPILERFSSDQSEANAFCVIWAIDSYATHIAFDGVATPAKLDAYEVSFKNIVSDTSWQFRVIREASNATKHAIHRVLEHPTFDGLTSDRR
ncbi:hypothetical protein, partial [Planktotalea frisia]|uniref:hypothetical protein n=1 Tax=Planktotalea frisia TaxID=696762 RepID=UPI001C318FDE